ncbi:hypothetical protein OHA25_33410 [Nonomuraea sp. NBC_00507]|uniref:hypothetical protein n=1 Tax=Nonomuraea sp. NBC_00507 TaxID=2976002 RepID=UPI002E198B1C
MGPDRRPRAGDRPGGVYRQAALERADQIIVLDRGRVAGRGPLDELLEHCPEMRRLWSAERITEAEEGSGD